MAARESWIVRQLVRLYRPALSFALQRAAAGLCRRRAAARPRAASAYYSLGSEFLPKLDEGDLWVRTFAPQSISPSESAAITQNVRRRLASFPEVRYVVSQLGRPDDGTDVNGWDVTEYSVGLKPREEWKTAHSRDALCEAMARNLREIPGIDSQFSQYIEDNVNEAVSGVKSELAIKLFGDDPVKLQAIADQIADYYCRRCPGAADVGADLLLGQPQIQITIDRAAIARYGLAVADIQTVVATAIGGQTATQVLEGDRTFDLVVKLAPNAVADVDSIRNIPVFGSNGERLTLGDLAAVNVKAGFVPDRTRGKRAAHRHQTFRARPRPGFGGAPKPSTGGRRRPSAARLPAGMDRLLRERAARRTTPGASSSPSPSWPSSSSSSSPSTPPNWPPLYLLTVPFSAVGGLLALPLARLEHVRGRPGGFCRAVRRLHPEQRDPGHAHPRIAPRGNGLAAKPSWKAPPRACGPW